MYPSCISLREPFYLPKDISCEVGTLCIDWDRLCRSVFILRSHMAPWPSDITHVISLRSRPSCLWTHVAQGFQWVNKIPWVGGQARPIQLCNSNLLFRLSCLSATHRTCWHYKKQTHTHKDMGKNRWFQIMPHDCSNYACSILGYFCAND